jgi:hypothetical protein
MRPWIRKHRIGALLLAVLALAGMGGILVFLYFTYGFTLRWANASGSRAFERSWSDCSLCLSPQHPIVRAVEAEHDGPVFIFRGTGAST